ncbi:MAG: DUF1097 domain-containing protein [Thermoleophilia bacterium]|nr:DUF1097 domain-containing protein [Thermoleophilia bacterium]
MGARSKAVLPLAIVIGVLAFLWVEFSLNFQFHWVTNGDLGVGLDLPANFQLPVWTAFVSWGVFFAAGGDNAAFGKVLVASVLGSVAALITFAVAPKIADLPDFWGISLIVGIMAFVLVAILIAGDWYYVAGTFPAFAASFGWWVSTGLDNWAPNGGGIGSGLSSLSDPATAGSGAFGGVLSTPFVWVWFSAAVTLICGVVLGIISAKVTAAITPRPRSAEASTT